MDFRRRLAVLESLAAAIEASARAMVLVIEGDAPAPPNVEKETKKTGPRSPFVFNRVEHLKRIYGDAKTSVDRERVTKIAKTLAAQGLISDRDVEEVVKSTK